MNEKSKHQISERSHSSFLKPDKPKSGFRMSRVRWAVATASAILVGTNAGVQLWQNLDLGDRVPWIEKPPAIEHVKPKTN